MYKIGIDYYLNDFYTLSVYTNQNLYLSSGNSTTRVDYQSNAFSDIFQTNDSHNKNPSGTYNLDFKHKFKKEGENIELEANYNRNKGMENSTFMAIMVLITVYKKTMVM